MIIKISFLQKKIFKSKEAERCRHEFSVLVWVRYLIQQSRPALHKETALSSRSLFLQTHFLSISLSSVTDIPLAEANFSAASAEICVTWRKSILRRERQRLRYSSAVSVSKRQPARSSVMSVVTVDAGGVPSWATPASVSRGHDDMSNADKFGRFWTTYLQHISSINTEINIELLISQNM